MISFRSSFGFRPAIPFSVLLLFGFGFSNAGFAQLPQTKLFAVYPAGGQRGSTVEVRISAGAELEEIQSLRFGHKGFLCKPKMQGTGKSAKPVLNTFLVTIPADVPVGRYEIRAYGKYGVSNPRLFEVGSFVEMNETEANNTLTQATAVEIERVVNGTIQTASDVDFFQFAGKRGQRLLVECTALRIDSRLKPFLEIFNEAGRRLAFARGQFHPDPVLDVTLPADGRYFLKIFDEYYNGNSEYNYRLKIHTGPRIEFVLPASVTSGKENILTVYGRNLPGGTPAGISVDGKPLQKTTVKLNVPNHSKNESGFRLPHQSGIIGMRYSFFAKSNEVFLPFSSAPVSMEKEPNDIPQKSQQLPVPCEVTGQFSARGDVDCYSFQARKGQVFQIELLAQRDGTAADPEFILEQVVKTKKGIEQLKRITVQDDNAANLAPRVFDTLSDDPAFRFQVPADGVYRLTIRDRYFESRGDPRLVYRLCIRIPKPDFRVIILPETPPTNPAPNLPTSSGVLALRKGEHYSARVLVERKDGFSHPVTVSVKNLPLGVSCPTILIDRDQTQGALIFSSTENCKTQVAELHVVATVRLDDPKKKQVFLTAQKQATQHGLHFDQLKHFAQMASTQMKAYQSELNSLNRNFEKTVPNPKLKKQLEIAIKTAGVLLVQTESALQLAKTQQDFFQKNLQIAKTEYEKTVKDIIKPTETASIVWNGTNVIPAYSHMTNSLVLSVLPESSHFQLNIKPIDLTVYQGRQILVPLELIKRNGFDNVVSLSLQGLVRNSRIAAKLAPIPKGKKTQLTQLFIAKNAKIGTHTFYLRGLGQVPYRRNLLALKIAQDAQKSASIAVTKTNGDLLKAKGQLAGLKKKLTELKQKQAAAKTNYDGLQKTKTNFQKQLTDSKTLLSASEKALPVKKVAFEKAKKLVLDAKKAAEKNAKNKQLVEAMKKSQQRQEKEKQELAKLENTIKKQQALIAGKQKDLAGLAKKLQTSIATLNRLAASNKITETEMKESGKTIQELAKQLQVTQNAKKSADQRLTAAQKASAPKNVIYRPPTIPIRLIVKPAPCSLSVSVSKGSKIKAGESREITVKIRRQNNFTGSVKLSLDLPPGVKGISAKTVEFPANMKSGKITLVTAKDATLGVINYLTVRATMQTDETAIVDAPLKLTIVK